MRQWQVAAGLTYGQVKKSYRRRKLVLVSPAKWLKQLEKLMKRMSFRNTWMSFLVVEASFLLLGFMRRSLEQYDGGCWR